MKILSKNAKLSGSISVPGSKSHTIRACLFAALANGESHILNPLESADCLGALDLIKNFGCKVEVRDDVWIINGIGSHWKQPSFVVDVKNSGTLLHFVTGILSTISGYSVITGDKSICTRPIQEQLRGLEELGAKAFTTRDSIDAPPVIINGPVKAGTAHLTGRLSQHVSGILMAGALTMGKTRIELSDPKEIPFAKMTISWLNSVGINVDYDKKDFKWLEIEGPNEFTTISKAMPSDWEGVAFPLAAAVLTGSEITIDNIDISKTQGDREIVNVLKSMGANIEINEEQCKLYVHKSNELNGITANLSNYPDALPMLSVVASFANGVSRFTDIGICRLKETDRIALMNKELTKLGVKVVEGQDYLEIHGCKGVGMHGGEVESYDDHRIAMALAVLGLALPKGEEVVVNEAQCCAVSFPNFYSTMNKINANFLEV